jgi:hypothetical protein
MKEKVKRTDPPFARNLDFAGRLWRKAEASVGCTDRMFFETGSQLAVCKIKVTGMGLPTKEVF